MISQPFKSAALVNIVLAASSLIVFGLSVSEIYSFDLFWQLQSGKHIWQTKSFIYKDTFTLASDVARYEHCWLHDLIVYGVYQVGGYQAISFLKGVLLTATFAMLVMTARLKDGWPAGIILISLPAFLLTVSGWLMRPQLWTFFFFALFVLVLTRHERVGDGIVYWLLPLLVIWANLHAGAVLAFPVMAAFAVGALLDRYLLHKNISASGIKKLFLTILFMVPAICLTPYGLFSIRTLVRAPKMGAESGALVHKYNVDWQLTTYFEHPWFYYLMAFVALLFLLQVKRVRFSDLLLLAGLAVMGLKLGRHTPFMLFAAAAVLPVYLASAYRDIKRLLPRRRTVIYLACMASLGYCLVTVSWATYQRQGFMQSGLRDWYYPRAATDFVLQHRLPGNLFNSYDWGGYLMWRLYPHYKVFWDGRQSAPLMYAHGREVSGGEESWQEHLDDFKVNTLLIKPLDIKAGARYRIIDRLRTSIDWHLVFADDTSLVFVRSGTMSSEWLRRFEKPKSYIDRTLLSLGTLLVGEPGLNRYQVYWEAFRVFFARGDYQQAEQNLKLLKTFAPEDVRNAEIVRYYDRVLAERLIQ